MPVYADLVEPDPCPLCERPNYHPSDHHLVPKSRGGKVTETICSSCHQAIHATFSNKELEETYYTVEALLAHPTFRGTVKYISKQNPARKIKTKRTNTRQRKP